MKALRINIVKWVLGKFTKKEWDKVSPVKQALKQVPTTLPGGKFSDHAPKGPGPISKILNETIAKDQSNFKKLKIQ